MPASPFPTTWTQVAAFRMARGRLLHPAPPDPAAIAADIAGAQAQVLSAAALSIAVRADNLPPSAIDDALASRTLVRASCMRRTLFLANARQLATLVRGTARRAEKDVRWTLGKGVPAAVVEQVIAATLHALDEPLTRPEIAERVCRLLGLPVQTAGSGWWGDRKPLAAVPVGDLKFPVVYLLTIAAARGVVCYGPSRGAEPTFVRADAWIPDWQDIAPQAAEAALLRLYLRAYGPAAPADFALWSGLSLTDARSLWSQAAPDLAPIDIEGTPAHLLLEDLDALRRAAFDGPTVRLLPHFDAYLLAHKQRTHLADPAHHPAIYRPQGWISPVILVNGLAAGVWKQARQGRLLRVTLEPFGALDAEVVAGIEEEALRLGRLLGAEEVRVDEIE